MESTCGKELCEIRRAAGGWQQNNSSQDAKAQNLQQARLHAHEKYRLDQDDDKELELSSPPTDPT